MEAHFTKRAGGQTALYDASNRVVAAFSRHAASCLVVLTCITMLPLLPCGVSFGWGLVVMSGSMLKACGIGVLFAVGTASLLARWDATQQGTTPPSEWTVWGGDAAQTHFSSLAQITPQNVAQLRPVWIYNPGTTGRGWENTPLLVDGRLYVSDPTGDILALDPTNGDPIWRWKSPQRVSRVRGLAYWAGDGKMKPRLLATRNGQVLGFDLKTGVPVTDWQNGGFNLGFPNAEGAIAAGGTNSSPPLIYKNMIVTATGAFQPGAMGGVRAFDLRDGKLLWHTRLVPAAGQPGSDSWGRPIDQIGGGGTWGILSVDERTGTIFVPTDSPGPDYVGIWRPGDNKWANSTVAIDAETGRIKWAFQTHHHDVFDWDSMAAPTFLEITRGGQRVPVVVQTTKLGMVWIFDARTGEPIHGFEERAGRAESHSQREDVADAAVHDLASASWQDARDARRRHANQSPVLEHVCRAVGSSEPAERGTIHPRIP